MIVFLDAWLANFPRNILGCYNSNKSNSRDILRGVAPLHPRGHVAARVVQIYRDRVSVSGVFAQKIESRGNKVATSLDFSATPADLFLPVCKDKSARRRAISRFSIFFLPPRARSRAALIINFHVNYPESQLP